MTKPGGYVGLNESTWLKMPPPPEMIEWVSQDLGAQVKPLTPDEWTGLLEGAGLTLEFVDVREVIVREETKGLVQRYGYGGIVRTVYRAMAMYARNPAYRNFLKRVRKVGVTPDDLKEYFGYGLYVGRK